MSEEIAVLIGRKGEVVTLYDAGKIVVYQKKCQQWNQVRTMDFCLEKELSMNQLRVKMGDLISFLDRCKVFAISSIGGVAYFELEKAGIKVWEVDGDPSGFLQLIMDEQEDSVVQTTEPGEKARPVAEEIYPGHFRISLLGLQGTTGGLTSKQIIQPILNQGRFQTLEIMCDHAPPWLEIKILTSELNGIIEKNSPGEVKITLFH